MFKLKKKTVINISILCLLALLISFSCFLLRAPFLNILKYPLYMLTLIQREFRGIIFYHRNFVQNERLKEEIDLLKNKLIAGSETHLENVRLKELLSLKQSSPYKLMAARVIGRLPDNWSSGIIIDKGKHNGIKRGMVAITYLGLVGRVIETAEFASKVMLISDPRLGISAIVQRSRQEGLVSGTLGTNLIMRYLPEDSDIKIQDVVITSGLNETFPKGVIIGSVVEIGNEFSGLSRYCLIRPAVNLSNIEEVLLIIK